MGSPRTESLAALRARDPDGAFRTTFLVRARDVIAFLRCRGALPARSTEFPSPARGLLVISGCPHAHPALRWETCLARRMAMSTASLSSGSWSVFLFIACLGAGGAALAHAEGTASEPSPPSASPGSTSRDPADLAGSGDGEAFSAQPDAVPAALDFAFTDLLGRERSLAAARGRVTLLEFWASWCVPCRKGFPFLDALQAKHAGAGLAVVAVTLEEDGDAVREFVESHPAAFLVGRDPSGRAGEIFEVGAIPTALLLDAGGRVLARFEGGTDEVHRQIEDAVGV